MLLFKRFLTTINYYFYVYERKIMKFLDQAKIFISSGKGGNGCVAFRREKYIEFGGPNGGDGGKGGDVIFMAVNGLNTLIDFRYQQHFKAQKGEHGKGDNRTGKSGEDLIIKVPMGTEILAEDGQTLLADLVEEGQTFLIAKGGEGGRGNTSFKSSVNQAPRQFTEGGAAEEMWVWLKLKVIADVGLIGMPNAGKSTFLAAVSRAKPKIADYPFTTLHPNLGMVSVHQSEMLIADIPGLIEGAHEGIGLGDKFLRHVERCKCFLHLLDGTDENAAENYKVIRKELELYMPKLAERPEFVALNKCDALTEEEIGKRKKQLEKACGKPVYVISGFAKIGLDGLLNDLMQCVQEGRNANP